MSTIQSTILVLLAIAVFPLYVFFVFKCASAGWASGTISYLTHFKSRRIQKQSSYSMREGEKETS